MAASVELQDQPAREGVELRRARPVVEHADPAVRQHAGVVLEVELRAGPEPEVAALAAERPEDPAARPVDLVDRRRVARRDQHAILLQRLDRVDVEGVVGGAVLRRRLRGLERDVAVGVPLPDHQPGLDVDLLDDRVEERRERAGRRPGQVHPDRRVDREERVAVPGELELVQVHRVAVAGVDDLDDVRYERFAITPSPMPKADGVTVPSHQVRTLRPLKRWSRRLAATSGGASCRNQTRLPLPSTIIGPPGPTGLIVTVLLLSGWTTGEGSGVSNTLAVPAGTLRALVDRDLRRDQPWLADEVLELVGLGGRQRERALLGAECGDCEARSGSASCRGSAPRRRPTRPG